MDLYVDNAGYRRATREYREGHRFAYRRRRGGVRRGSGLLVRGGRQNSVDRRLRLARRDADGVQDTSERGVKGVIVNLLDEGMNIVASSVTDAEGLINSPASPRAPTRSRLPRATLPLWLPCGSAATLRDQGTKEAMDSDGDPITHMSGLVILAAGQQNADIDFGFKLPAGGDDRGKGNNGSVTERIPHRRQPPITTTRNRPGNPGNKGGVKAGGGRRTPAARCGSR